jgi:menaquinone-dependent protoporphyrinogen oxidase
MRVLVVYGTKSGCTQGIAERIGEDLAKQGASVDVVAAEDAGDPSGYDAVLVGSGVRAGKWHAAARAWVESNADSFEGKPVAFYTCGMMIREEGKEDEVRAYSDPVADAAGIEPVDVGLFAGWFEPKQFGFAERAILKMMKVEEGDFRDWDAVDAWADKVAPQLGVGG